MVKQEKKTLNQFSDVANQLMTNAQQNKQEMEGALYMSRFGLKNLFDQKEKNAKGNPLVIPPFLENISKDIMTNRKVKIFLAKSTL